MKYYLYLILTILLSSQAAALHAGDASPFSPPVDDRENWSIGICSLEVKDVTPANSYLSHSVPLQFKKELQSISSHYFSEAEKRGYRESLLKKERRKQGDNLAKLRVERDELLFNQSKDTTLDAKIEETIDYLNYLRNLELSDIELADQKAVEFKSGQEEGQLLAPPLYSPLRYAHQQEVELLIWGTLEEYQGYLYFEVYALSPHLGKEVFVYRNAVLPEEISYLLSDINQELAVIVLGSESVSLTIHPEPMESEIYLDGAFVGSGVTALKFLLPGEKTLRVSCQGYLEEYRQIELVPGEHYDLWIALAAREMEYLSVNSKPQGASIYHGSQWLGRTPLEMAVPAPAVSSRLLLRKEGYKDYPFYLDSSFTGNIDLTLERDILADSVVQTKKRDQFYRAFGIWALTVPLPFFLYGITADYALAFQMADYSGNPEASRLRSTGVVFYYSYLGALFISSSLFLKMIFNLFDYISSADRKAG